MGDNYTASLMLGNIDLLKNSGVVVGHYLQVNICGSSHVIFS